MVLSAIYLFRFLFEMNAFNLTLSYGPIAYSCQMTSWFHVTFRWGLQNVLKVTIMLLSLQMCYFSVLF